MTAPALHRGVMAALSLAAIGTLALQTGVDLNVGTLLVTSLWEQSRFFTNTTVLLVAIICGWTALRGWPGVSWPAGLVVWIVLVGVVYHALLAATHHPEGWDVTVNWFQHTLLPIGVALAWLAFAPKTGLSWRDPVLWAAYPLIYAIYALTRGLLGDSFPYFFLNPVKTGWGGVTLYILGLGVLFFATGWLLVQLSRRLPQRI